MLTPDRDQGDFDLMQRVLLVKPRPASLLVRLLRALRRAAAALLIPVK